MRRRDLHTVLPKHVASTASNSPRLSKTMSMDDKIDTNSNPQLKRPQLNSTSSDSGIIADSDNDLKIKRPKIEDNNESSSKPSQSNLATTE